ncbi:uncharacterized protein GGS22DRAFT_20924 [Annulohypoxylon maeteangense]|uniref:uncharacterized protein n=1 Tax=Annulohypoxylon maeteangense TaxID=1927788 RepID=UPI0020078EA4|nr:uncharacterized protein GGS22DRAFT_20924 [Annulohypoxylon maeteangense]KAI0884236.1 hypothetical protein GGS22DRAFT_20924 [Annulohypoxylon maeteangense]
MSDYASLKVPELKKLLQEKSLPVTGNKADLIARLQEHDKPKAEPAQENEDEIDYSDDDVPAATKPTESAKAVEPTPVPVEGKPSESSTIEAAKESVDAATLVDKPTETEVASEETANPEILKADFSAHLPASDADEEARKRAERAKRFGIVEDEEDKKKTARTERFGVDSSSLAKGLDSALPEKRAPKRGREGGNGNANANIEGERGAKRQNPGGRHRGKGRFRHGGGGSGRQGGPPRKEGNSTAPRGRSGIMNDPTEKAKAEARAKRFGGGS